MRTSHEKGAAFRALHARPGAFLIPNPWDIGTARLLAQLGFEALATTSAGYAFSAGRRDNQIPRDEMLAHAAAIVSATDLPVSADLENGYGKTLDAVSETYRLAGGTGLAGASIEDASQDPANPQYEIEVAADRVRAAVSAVRALPHPFVLTARAENFLVGRPDLHDAIRRLQAYQEAGADALYIPGLTSRDDIATVIRSVDRPVNVLMGMQGVQLSLSDLSELGVRRVSIGSALTRAAYGAFLRAAKEMREHGTFTFAKDAVPFQSITQMF